MIALAFLVMMVSGAALIFIPSGKIAGELGWLLLGLARTQWETLPLTMRLVTIGATLWHLSIHICVVRKLLWSATAPPLCHRRELTLGLGLVLAAVLGSVLNLPRQAGERRSVAISSAISGRFIRRA